MNLRSVLIALGVLASLLITLGTWHASSILSRYYRNSVPCPMSLQRHGSYKVYWTWDNGLGSVRFVDERSGKEETSIARRCPVLKTVTENVSRIMGESKLNKAEGWGYVTADECVGVRFEVRWDQDPDRSVVTTLSQLHHAAECWDLNELQRLLGEGVNVNAGFAGDTPLFYAVADPRRDKDLNCNSPPDPTVINLLLQRGADPNARDQQGLTPLMFADSSAAGRLISAGADVNARDDLGQTPLIWTALRRNSDLETIKIELAAHADVNATDLHGWTALMRATQVGRIAYIKTLLAAGADRRARNKDGQTAFMIAREREPLFPGLRKIEQALSTRP